MYRRNSTTPMPRTEWTRKEIKTAKMAARQALESVGEEKTDIHENGEITYVIRRLCKDSERQLVTENYLSA